MTQLNKMKVTCIKDFSEFNPNNDWVVGNEYPCELINGLYWVDGAVIPTIELFNNHFKLAVEKKEVTYEDIEKLTDDVTAFVKSKNFDLLDEFEFRTRLEEILYEGIDNHEE